MKVYNIPLEQIVKRLKTMHAEHFRFFIANKKIGTSYEVSMAYDSETYIDENFLKSMVNIPKALSDMASSKDGFTLINSLNIKSPSKWLFETMESDDEFYVMSLEKITDQNTVFILATSSRTQGKALLLSRLLDIKYELEKNVITYNLNMTMESMKMYRLREMAYMLNAHDPYLYIHSLRVADIASFLAYMILEDESEAQKAFYAGLIHDLGEMWIPVDILNKKGKLTDEEYAYVKGHVARLDELFWGDPNMAPIVEVAKLHHERLDGTGYLGYKADDLSMLARIMAVADVTSALMDDRSYRKARPIREIMEILDEMAGEKLDEYVVEKAKEIISDFYTGAVPEYSKMALKMHPVVIMASFPDREMIFQGFIMNVMGKYVEINIPNFDKQLTIDSVIRIEAYIGAMGQSFSAKVTLIHEKGILAEITEQIEREKSLRITWDIELLVLPPRDADPKDKRKGYKTYTKMFGSDGLSFIVDKDDFMLKSGEPLRLVMNPYGEIIDIDTTVIDVVDIDFKRKECLVAYTNMKDSNVSLVYRSIFKREIEMKNGLKLFRGSGISNFKV